MVVSLARITVRSKWISSTHAALSNGKNSCSWLIFTLLVLYSFRGAATQPPTTVTTPSLLPPCLPCLRGGEGDSHLNLLWASTRSWSLILLLFGIFPQQWEKASHCLHLWKPGQPWLGSVYNLNPFRFVTQEWWRFCCPEFWYFRAQLRKQR